MEDDNEMEDDCNENALINNRLLQLNNSFLIVNNLQWMTEMNINNILFENK